MRSLACLLALMATCAPPKAAPKPPEGPQPRVTTIGTPERWMSEWIDQRTSAVQELRSASKTRDRCRRELRRLGFKLEEPDGGPLIARRHGRKGSKVLLLVPSGAGGGLTILLFALRTLGEKGHLGSAQMTVLIGDDLQRPIEEEASRHQVAFGFDAGPVDGLVRRGTASDELIEKTLGIAQGLGRDLRLVGPTGSTPGGIARDLGLPGLEALGVEGSVDEMIWHIKLASIVLYRHVR